MQWKKFEWPIYDNDQRSMAFYYNRNVVQLTKIMV